MGLWTSVDGQTKGGHGNLLLHPNNKSELQLQLFVCGRQWVQLDGQTMTHRQIKVPIFLVTGNW